MAKREFIDKNELLDKVQDYGEDQNKLMLIDPYYVRNAHIFTEQDIVKPYLTKLKAKMFDLPKAEGKTYWDAVDDIGDMIDGLLSEQGDADENAD